MRVRVLFFASLRERFGDREVVRTVEDGATAADLVARLRADFPALDEAGRFAIAVNSEYTDGGHRLADGDGAAALADLLEHVGHLRLQVEALEEDDVGALEATQVAFAGLVDVRVDAGAHQVLHAHPLAADAGDSVTDHADRGDRGDPLLRREVGQHRLADRAAAGEHSGEERSHCRGKKFRHG